MIRPVISSLRSKERPLRRIDLLGVERPLDRPVDLRVVDLRLDDFRLVDFGVVFLRVLRLRVELLFFRAMEVRYWILSFA